MRYLKNILYVTVIAIGAINLSGCKFGPNFTKPEPITNAHYMFDTLQTDSVVNVSWWEMFNDDVLDTLIQTALDSNKDVLIAASRIEEYRATLGYKKSETWPAFGYQGNGSYGNFSSFYLPEANGNGSGGLNMNWEIDFWGKYRRATESARADLLANEYARRTVQISLISDVTSSYFAILDYEWRIRIAKSTLELREENVDILEQKFDAGLVPEIDLNNAQQQYAIALSTVPKYERSLAFEQTRLGVLLGANPRAIVSGTILEDQIIPPAIPVGLPSSLLLRRPDIGYSEAKYHAQMAKIGVAQAQRFPAISLTGFLGVSTNALSSVTAGGLAWNAAGALAGPIFQFGKNKRRVEIEYARTEQTKRDYEKTVITAFKEVEDALISVTTYTEELRARELQTKAALNAQKLSQLRYDKGVTSYLEVITLQGYAFDAELTLSLTRRSLFDSYVSLYKSLGGGWISEKEMNDAAKAQREPNTMPSQED